MRTVDVMLAFPPLLFLLVLITGAGTGVGVLVDRRRRHPGAGHQPHRAHRDARGVGAGLRRGRPSPAASGPLAVVVREVLPNILAPVLVDAGLRFTYSILIIASVNFLGLGLQPPSSDWALMISENREYISLNVVGGARAGGDDRPAHDRHQPDGRRDRPQPRPLVRAADGPERGGVSTDGGGPVIRVENLVPGPARPASRWSQDVSFSVDAGRDPRAWSASRAAARPRPRSRCSATPAPASSSEAARSRSAAQQVHRARRARAAEPARAGRLVRARRIRAAPSTRRFGSATRSWTCCARTARSRRPTTRCARRSSGSSWAPTPASAAATRTSSRAASSSGSRSRWRASATRRSRCSTSRPPGSTC